MATKSKKNGIGEKGKTGDSGSSAAKSGSVISLFSSRQDLAVEDLPAVFSKVFGREPNDIFQELRDADFPSEIDLAVEGLLEKICELLLQDSVRFFEVLQRAGFNPDAIKEAIRENWLYLEDLDPTVYSTEITVRAAEFLGEWSKASGEDIKAVEKRLTAEKHQDRLWAANAVRAIQPENAAELLEPLREDPYQDDNGLFLVREAAGFKENEDEEGGSSDLF